MAEPLNKPEARSDLSESNVGLGRWFKFTMRVSVTGDITTPDFGDKFEDAIIDMMRQLAHNNEIIISIDNTTLVSLPNMEFRGERSESPGM